MITLEMGSVGLYRCTLAEYLLSAEDTSGDSLKQSTLPLFIPVYNTLLEALVTRAQVRRVVGLMSVHSSDVFGGSSLTAYILYDKNMNQ